MRSWYVVRYLRETFTLRVENEPVNPGRGSKMVNPFYVTMTSPSWFNGIEFSKVIHMICQQKISLSHCLKLSLLHSCWILKCTPAHSQMLNSCHLGVANLIHASLKNQVLLEEYKDYFRFLLLNQQVTARCQHEITYTRYHFKTSLGSLSSVHIRNFWFRRKLSNFRPSFCASVTM